MNAIQRAKSAYGTTRETIRTPKSIEFEAFARISHSLKSAEEKGKKGFNSLVQALDTNRKLWTILAADVAEEKNPLPQELKARIFYLAEFTNLHTRKVLKREASAQVLIEINMSIMRGLKAGAANQ
ncbi:flagellar biosynthesis regulator FlaF [Halocynthiibacter sp. C4]|uniref:flagellar biosynthesis regulator FlaF n=1 Tax=Halocynthiibacter sp. C4 TaxID=2992758 RepID=UPI00237ABCBF|nr:flagellar biosynthesis regulator FlaF [Halocynthiibacter sp. C4]MDE0591363.1 flagellar biosynthesis regulator FlaF [Halocynthiibacter sp. C4]